MCKVPNKVSNKQWVPNIWKLEMIKYLITGSDNRCFKIVLSKMAATRHMWLFKFNLKFSASVTLATGQVLHSRVWLMATTVDSTGMEHHRSSVGQNCSESSE